MASSAIQTKEVLLWTNPNPTTSMSEQWITIPDISAFRYITVIASESTAIFRIGSCGMLEYVNWDATYGDYLERRVVNISNDKKLHVSGCWLRGIGNNSVVADDNSKLIPLEVYGVY